MNASNEIALRDGAARQPATPALPARTVASSAVISIVAMVRVGPWTIESVEHGAWRHCDRCQAWHKEVWICTVEANAGELDSLRGQRTWRIGSTCGPALMLVSEERWKSETKVVVNGLRVLLRARRALAAAAVAKVDFWALSLIVKRAELLQRGELSPQLTRWLSSHVGQLETALRPCE